MTLLRSLKTAGQSLGQMGLRVKQRLSGLIFCPQVEMVRVWVLLDHSGIRDLKKKEFLYGKTCAIRFGKVY